MKTLLCLALLAVYSRAATPPAAAQAQQHFDAGDYAAAASLFEQLAREQPQEPAWRYDLGNALFKLGRLGPAVASYQRAYALAPRDGDVRYNLDFALKRAGEERVPTGVPALLFDLYHLISDAELAGLYWLTFCAAMLLSAFWIAAPARRTSVTTPALWAMGGWLFLGAWWGARRMNEPAYPAVIVKASAELRNGPGDSFTVTFTVPEGRRVDIFADQGAWLEVGVAKEGAKGWLRAVDVEKL